MPPTSAVVNLPHSVVAGKQWNKFLGEVSAPAKVIPANNEISRYFDGDPGWASNFESLSP